MRKNNRAEVLQTLEVAAAAGTPPPHNAEIGAALGGLSEHAVELALKSLRRKGIIALERESQYRRFTILATGQQTAWGSGGGALREALHAAGGPKKRPGSVPPSKWVKSNSPAAKLQRRVYEYLASLAEVAAPMPTNDDLMARFSASRGAIEAAIRRLRGSHIHSERDGGNRRRVVIAATGKATGWSVAGVTPQGVSMAFVQPAMAIPCAPRNGGKDWPAWRTCQFIAGDPKDRGFCGAPTQQGSSYCRAHHALCNIAGSAERLMEVAA